MTSLSIPVKTEILSGILRGKKPLAADVGGRYGLHRFFRPLLGLGHLVIFDADPDAESLELDGLITVRAGLSGRGGPRKLRITRSGGLSSFFVPNRKLFETYEGTPAHPEMAANRVDIIREITVETVVLEQALDERKLPSPDYLKLDVQGLELEILETLVTRPCIIEVEAEWAEMYQEQPLAPAVCALLDSRGYSLFGIRSSYWGLPTGRRDTPYVNRGRLIFSDLLFVREAPDTDPDILAAGLYLYGYFAEAAGIVKNPDLAAAILNEGRLSRWQRFRRSGLRTLVRNLIRGREPHHFADRGIGNR